jgi:hypothetical protein
MHGSSNGLLQGKLLATPEEGAVAQDAIARCDLDGDGFQDIVALVTPPSGGPLPVIYRGNGSTLVRDAAKLPSHGEDSEAFATIACADVDADGYPEIAVGAPHSSARYDLAPLGDLLIFDNAMGKLSTQGKSVAGQEIAAQAYSASRLRTVGDMNADGADELAFGFRLEVEAIQIAFSALSGLPADTVEIGGTPDVSGYFGAAFGTGDFDGDGLADVVVSSPKHGAGRLTLFRGSGTSRVTSPSAIHFDAPDGITGLGWMIADR